ncbi:MAG: helix-turn-helix transcriptional regulator [Chitinophagales bacterium]|nr:helix-turn-helix transcriptional regulator [Hyphomicrobiales bacterium]
MGLDVGQGQCYFRGVEDQQSTQHSSNALERLLQLPSGRHYGASADSGCWVMVGRNLVDVTSWSTVPPDASLTLAWGAGGCSIEFAGGGFEMRPGECMWIDGGFAHRGENTPGSDFLTIFIPARQIAAAPLYITPIGAASLNAPPDISGMLVGFAGLLLDGAAKRLVEAPLLDAVLDWVGTCFQPQGDVDATHDAVLRAATMLRESQGDAISIASVADSVGLRPSELSHRFKAYHRVTPETYRKQVRLAHATRSLAEGSPVVKAAHEAGFADTAHLSRTFRQQYGVSPSDWARRFRPTGHRRTE